MANDEKKLATAQLIPLEIDPTSILSLSKGVIFDTIVHNIEYTLSNRRTDHLPWRLIGMSLICDPNRNKKYMQKLQKMQCVPSVICTQIYHSKLVKNDSGVLATPGRKITVPTNPPKRLTGIMVCRSIDELLFMESPNTENVHYIQYKLLSYERLVTRELVNGPKLTSVGDKIIKTVFDFELTQSNAFPRQLLPVAIITFGRQEGSDLCGSIRHFLGLEEHKTFDKSYLVTSINVEFDRLREEEESKEDAEIERELVNEKVQRRQPLADLSRRTTDTGNARSVTTPSTEPRIPPLKIKVPRQEKPSKPKISLPPSPLNPKFDCFLKLDPIDLSMYDISNLSDLLELKKSEMSSHSPTNSNNNNNNNSNKTKPLTIKKPYEHQKLLKRLNTSEPKRNLSLPPAQSSKNKSKINDAMSIRSSTSDISILSIKTQKNRRSTSTSSMSPIYRPKPTVQKQIAEKPVTKKKVNRPPLPSEYKCSIPLTKIDLSMYDLDLPPLVDTPPSSTEPTVTPSPSTSTSSERQIGSKNPSVGSEHIQILLDPIESIPIMDKENNPLSEIENIFESQKFIDTTTYQPALQIIQEFSTPDLNETLSNMSTEVLPSLSNDQISPQPTEEPLSVVSKEVPSMEMNESINETTDEIISPELTKEILPSTAVEAVSTVVIEDKSEPTLVVSSSPPPCSSPYIALSPDLPPLDDDPVLISIDNPSIPPTDTSDSVPQDCIIIVPCSDDEDDILDDNILNDIKIGLATNKIETKVDESLSSSLENNPTSTPLRNPSLTRVLMSTDRSKSHRLSTSSTSSCSSISTSILHNQSPGSPFQLIQLLIPQKIFNKKQRKSSQIITFSRYDLLIPLLTQESLVDPRLIYRLQALTTDLHWPNRCQQCTITPYLPSLFSSSTQTILYDRKSPLDFVDPRRESLKNAILDHLYQRIKILIPNIFIINSNQFQKLLYEQTIFKTNCSLHLEYLLHKLKTTEDMNFFQMMKTTDEFQLSPLLLQLIFN